MIRCPDCGREVSDAAPACPQCGRPGASAVPVAKQPTVQARSGIMDGVNLGCGMFIVLPLILLGLAALALMALSRAGR